MDDSGIRLSFHIGMGKTGTSAIQAALRQSPALLREHGIGYLGMWWTAFDASLEGPAGMEAAAKLDPEKMRALAQRIVAHVRVSAKRDALTHFVFSNEALYAHTDAYEPLYRALAEHLDVRFVVYVREPRQWLASAYAQWGIRHRPESGPESRPAPSFAEWAEAHIGIYDGLRWWHRHHAKRLTVRRFDPAQDVVADFVSAIGSQVTLPSARVYATPEPALLLLQAAFDDQPGSLAAGDFASQVWDLEGDGAPPRLERAIARHFDQSSVPALLERWREVFDGIRDELGIDLLEAGTQGLPAPSPEMLRERLLDCLMAIVLRQARRIAALEARLDARDDD